jgi:hypothetical protein
MAAGFRRPTAPGLFCERRPRASWLVMLICLVSATWRLGSAFPTAGWGGRPRGRAAPLPAGFGVAIMSLAVVLTPHALVAVRRGAAAPVRLLAWQSALVAHAVRPRRGDSAIYLIGVDPLLARVGLRAPGALAQWSSSLPMLSLSGAGCRSARTRISTSISSRPPSCPAALLPYAHSDPLQLAIERSGESRLPLAVWRVGRSRGRASPGPRPCPVGTAGFSERSDPSASASCWACPATAALLRIARWTSARTRPTARWRLPAWAWRVWLPTRAPRGLQARLAASRERAFERPARLARWRQRRRASSRRCSCPSSSSWPPLGRRPPRSRIFDAR